MTDTVIGSMLALAPAAHADDWLALAPGCSHPQDARTLGRMALLYPRIGLPAMVEVGDRLITRVRVPSPLTPPPGIQQDRALVGWSAELVGHGRALFGGSTEHRYPLRVVDVRPDGPSTLVYRATLLIPHWAAPGTYSLRLSAPGGTDTVASVVRLLPPGARSRIGQLGALPESTPDGIDALSDAAADVWVAADEARLRSLLDAAVSDEARPRPVVLLLGPDEPAVILRSGAEAWVLGRCDDRDRNQRRPCDCRNARTCCEWTIDLVCSGRTADLRLAATDCGPDRRPAR